MASLVWKGNASQTGSKTQQVGSPPEWSLEHVAAPQNKRNVNSFGQAHRQSLSHEIKSGKKETRLKFSFKEEEVLD